MPVFIEDDPREELAVLREWERRVTASQAQMRAWSPLQAATLSAWADQAPFVEPDAIRSLAYAGITPDSAVGREIARAGAQDYYGGWRAGSEPDNAPRAKTGGRVLSKSVEAYRSIEAARANDGGGGGFFGAVRRGFETALDFTNFGGDDRVRMPSASEQIGDAVGTVVETIGDVQDQGRAMSRAALPEPVGMVSENLSDATEAVARTGLMGANALLQEGQASFRQGVENVRERGFLGALNPFDVSNRRTAPESDALIALEHLVSGERVDVGSGILVDPRSGVAQERFRRELSHGTADGHVITPGRWLVDSVLGMDPGDTGYSTISGTFDAGVAIGADPTNWIGAQVANTVRAGRTITTTGRIVDDAVDAVGAMTRGVVPDIDPNSVASWLTSGPGARIVEDMAADGDFYSLWLKTSGKIDADTLLRIADEGDPDMVRRILFDEAKLNAGPDFPYRPPVAGHGTWARRAFADMPVERVRLDNPDEFLRGLDGMLVNARVARDDIAPLMRQAAEARNMLDRANVWESGLQTVNRTIVDEFGVDPVVGRRLTSWLTDEHATQRRMFFWRSAGDPDVATAVVDGEASYLRHAHLDSEMAPEVVTVPNVREIRRLTGALRDMGPLLMDEAGNLRLPYRFLDGVSSQVWKRTVLLRAAWPVRQVLIDEQLRLAAMGLPSTFRHPVQLVAGMLDSRWERKLLEQGAEPNGLLYAADELSDSLLNSIPYENVRRKAVEE